MYFQGRLDNDSFYSCDISGRGGHGGGGYRGRSFGRGGGGYGGGGKNHKFS